MGRGGTVTAQPHNGRKSRSWRTYTVGNGETFSRDGTVLHFGLAEDFYESWESPVCIVSDGPYGIGGFPGDPPTPDTLAEIYAPHVAAWSEFSTPQTTLWFWNTELGWATVHPLLLASGWEYRCCHIWDKGLSHVAGNANSVTLRKFPVVTEVCVQYVKAAKFVVCGELVSMQDWLRHEWKRTGLPFRLANEATGTLNAATRKYLTSCHLWYFPPVDAFVGMVKYANQHGDPSGRPYFSVNGKRPLTASEWGRMRSKFHCEVGINNVWRAPPVRGTERLKKKYKCIHNNQKPRKLIDICISSCTDVKDVVWEPFGGLCTTAICSHQLGRRCYSAEMSPEYYLAATERLDTYDRTDFTT